MRTFPNRKSRSIPLKPSTRELTTGLEDLLANAAESVLDIYGNEDFDVVSKADGSPLTRADRAAHECIVDGLSRLTPDLPVLSEESAAVPFEVRRKWRQFWLVDPLDGTKEFIKRNGEFTLNIALVEGGKPLLGAVFAPVPDLLYIGSRDEGSWCRRDGSKKTLSGPGPIGNPVRLVASRSHRGEAVDAFHQTLVAAGQPCEFVSMGSSLKLCLVAEGEADVYPRFGPTMEWDTAAAQAVAEYAGCEVLSLDGTPLVYNKQDLLNPWFIVGARGSDWLSYLPQS